MQQITIDLQPKIANKFNNYVQLFGSEELLFDKFIEYHVNRIKREIARMQIELEKYEKQFADDKGLIEGEVYFIDESCLEFLEVINSNQLNKEKYKFQYMDKDKQLIFRYDNARHHNDIKTFPHHKHIEETVLESIEPNLEQILSEIEYVLINR